MSGHGRTRKGRGSSRAQRRSWQRVLSEKSPLVVAAGLAGVVLVPIVAAAISCYSTVTAARIANENASGRQIPLPEMSPSSPDPSLLRRERTSQPKSDRDEIRYPAINAKVSDTWNAVTGEYLGSELYVNPYKARHRPRDGGLAEGKSVPVVCQILDGHPMASSPRFGSPVPSTTWYRLKDGRWIPDAFVTLDEQVIDISTVPGPVPPICRPEDR